MTTDAGSPRPPSRRQRFVRFPLTRLVLGVFWMGLVIALVELPLQIVAPPSAVLRNLAGAVILAGVALLAYYAFVRVVERRAVTELAPSAAPGELGLGLALGAALFTVTLGIIALFGYYRITGANGWRAAVPEVTLSVVSGVIEEIFFRALLFRITQEALGTWLALLVSAVVFGLLHLANPNATLVAGLAIALEAGIMLAAAYLVTGRLWLSIGIHFAWNFTQGGVFGAAVSGISSTGLLRSVLQGPVLLTGGDFGAEASLVAVVVCGLFGAYLVWRAGQMGKFVRPWWQRGK